MLLLCQRLDKAVRAGLIEEIAAWYGNTDGDNRVDGWDNIRNRVTTSDDSHLWHFHITFRRRFAGDWTVMRRTFTILTGRTQESTMVDVALTTDQNNALAETWATIKAFRDGGNAPAAGNHKGGATWLATQLAALRADAAADRARDEAAKVTAEATLAAVKALATAGGVDAAPIVAAVQAVGDEARREFAARAAENVALRDALAQASDDAEGARLEAAALRDALAQASGAAASHLARPEEGTSAGSAR
jgi:hypothetical protein